MTAIFVLVFGEAFGFTGIVVAAEPKLSSLSLRGLVVRLSVKAGGLSAMLLDANAAYRLLVFGVLFCITNKRLPAYIN